MDVCVHEIEGAMFKSEIEDCEDCTNCMRGEQFVGRRGLYSSFLYEENYGFYAIIM